MLNGKAGSDGWRPCDVLGFVNGCASGQDGRALECLDLAAASVLGESATQRAEAHARPNPTTQTLGDSKRIQDAVQHALCALRR